MIEIDIGRGRLAAAPPAFGEGVLAVHVRAEAYVGIDLHVAVHIPPVVGAGAHVGISEVLGQRRVRRHRAEITHKIVYGRLELGLSLAVEGIVVSGGHLCSGRCDGAAYGEQRE